MDVRWTKDKLIHTVICSIADRGASGPRLGAGCRSAAEGG